MVRAERYANGEQPGRGTKAEIGAAEPILGQEDR
jgi:hypothetical protein